MDDFFNSELIKKFEEMLEQRNEYYFDSEEYAEIISHYIEIGDFNFADLATMYGLGLHPQSQELQIKKFEVLVELGQLPQALEWMEKLEATSMQNIDYLISCAKYYSSKTDSKTAISFCLKALELDEEQDFIHSFIAEEYQNLNDPFNALKHYKKCLELDIYDDFALESIMLCYSELGQSQDAIDFLNQYIDQNPYSEAAWLEYGIYYYNQELYKEALVAFEYLLAINNKNFGVYSNKASCYEQMKQWSNAIATYTELLEHEESKSFTYYKIGQAYRELDLKNHAIRAFKLSMTEDPQFYLSMMELSEIYTDNKQYKEALFFGLEANKHVVNDLNLQKKLAYIYINLSMVEESSQCLKTIISIEPNQFTHWYAYCEILMYQEEFDEAMLSLNQAIERFPKAEFYYQLSHCLQKLNRKTEAKQSLRKALKINPKMADAMLKKYPDLKIDLDAINAEDQTV